MNVEFHHHVALADYDTRWKFVNKFDEFLRYGPFALMHADSMNAADSEIYFYHRMYFLNVEDEICVKKFLC
jgi:hypothetical protein